MTVVVACALAACSSDDNQSSSTGAPTTAAPTTAAPTTAEAPQTTQAPGTTGVPAADIDPDAEISIATASAQDSLDPHRTTGGVYATYQFEIYDRLFAVDKSGNVQPMLAKSFKFAPDGSSMTIELRDDVVFHDGSPLNAAAVKATIERGKTLEGSTVAAVLKPITSVEIVDDYTAKFNLEGGSPALPAALATNAGEIVNPAVLSDPKVDLGKAPPPAAGSGPYVVDSSEPNVSTTYVRAPEYWNPDVPGVAKLTVIYVQQAASRLAGLQAGDYDIAVATSDVYEQAQSLAKSGTFKIYDTQAGGSARDILLNADTPALADLDVRKAIAMGINRADLGLVYPCVEHTQTQQPGNWAFNSDIKNLPYDPEGAKKLLEGKGDVSFDMVVIAGSSFESMATAVQGQLAEIGIKVNVVPKEFSAVLQSLTAGDYPSVLIQMDQQGDPIVTLNRYFVAGWKLLRGDLAARVAATAAKGADVTLTQDERAPIYKDAFKQIADGVVYIPICRAGYGWAYNKNVVGFEGMDRPGQQDYTYLAVVKD